MALLDDFIAYVQRELFKRPFTNDDPNQESVIIRRGGSPRQLAGSELKNGQVLGKQNGVITGINVSDIGGGGGAAERKLIHEEASPSLLWTIAHEYDSTNVEVYVVDLDGDRIEPDSIRAVDASTVQITFAQAQAGKAFLKWFD